MDKDIQILHKGRLFKDKREVWLFEKENFLLSIKGFINPDQFRRLQQSLNEQEEGIFGFSMGGYVNVDSQQFGRLDNREYIIQS